MEEKLPLISVIIPIYNVEKYLKRCIDSVINQTYKNIEVLLIDDGSTDSSSKICDFYKNKDSRIKVYHKENEGPSIARNLGIQEAKGEYISFIDSDDWLDNEFLEQLFEIARKENTAITGCATVREFEDGKRIFNHADRKTGIISGTNCILDILYQTRHAWGAMYAKIYRKDIIKNIRFPNVKHLEDYVVSLQLFLKVHEICFYNKPLYHYNDRDNSLSKANFSQSKLSCITTSEKIRQYFINNNSDKEIINAADYFVFLMYSNTLWECFHSDFSDKGIVIQQYKKNGLKSFMRYMQHSRKRKSDLKIVIKFFIAIIC